MRKIAIITGSRADYGLLYSLIKKVHADVDFELLLLVTGMHLSPEFGLTVREIERDGFPISDKIEMLLSANTETAISVSMGIGMIGFARAYQRLGPDALVVLGDRFEILAAVTASVPFRLPVIHISGGEITEGSLDDSVRHAITKLSHLHFTSTEEYRTRVIQMGEQPNRVFNVGALGLDGIRNLKLLSKSKLSQELKFSFGQYNLLVTFHPITIEQNASRCQFQALLDALDRLTNTNIIFTKANADMDGRVINDMIEDFVQQHPANSAVFASLGQIRYLSAMQYVDAVVGNSSSGIVEAPSFKIATINIGNRQQGRIKAKSTIDCPAEKDAILTALKKAFSPAFQNHLRNVENPYGNGKSSDTILRIIKRQQLRKLVEKKHYDIDFKVR